MRVRRGFEDGGCFVQPAVWNPIWAGDSAGGRGLSDRASEASDADPLVEGERGSRGGPRRSRPFRADERLNFPARLRNSSTGFRQQNERTMSKTITGPDGQPRCRWCGAAPEFLGYHDTEWGFPVKDDHRLFEKLGLEGFQSGLSWRTILAKRENFRAAFHDFDFDRIARFTRRDIDRLLRTRHRSPSRQDRGGHQQCAAGSGARRRGRLAGSLHLALRTSGAACKTAAASTSAESIALSKDLKKQAGNCRTDHGLCLHASNGVDQRSCRGLRGQSQS